MAAGKFEVYADKSHKWRWRLKDDQGRVIATSPIRPAHDTADEAKAACALVETAAAGVHIDEL